MYKTIRNYGLLAICLIAWGCSHQPQYEDVYNSDYFAEPTGSYEDCPTCQDKANADFDDRYMMPDNLYGKSRVDAAGVRWCPPKKRCPDSRLPPRPCAQPIPAYYGNVSQSEIADGIVLIHPYTRTQIICYEGNGMTADECAQVFHNKGYVLITDIPQLPAKYDFLRDGTYPTRRWRGGGEVVPRW